MHTSKLTGTDYDFTTETSGDYSFFTIATDYVGNRENSKYSSTQRIFLGTAPPLISTTKDTLCIDQTASLTATNCTGLITRSNGQTGTSISVSITRYSIFTDYCI